MWQIKNNIFPKKKIELKYCVKSVRIRSFSGPYFPAFGLNTERYSVLCISPYSVRMRENTEQKTPNTDTFHAVIISTTTKKGNYEALQNILQRLKVFTWVFTHITFLLTLLELETILFIYAYVWDPV